MNDVGHKDRQEVDAVCGTKTPDQLAAETFRRREGGQKVRRDPAERSHRQGGNKHERGVAPGKLAAQAEAVFGKSARQDRAQNQDDREDSNGAYQRAKRELQAPAGTGKSMVIECYQRGNPARARKKRAKV